MKRKRDEKNREILNRWGETEREREKEREREYLLIVVLYRLTSGALINAF
jgi:hypothetical protein